MIYTPEHCEMILRGEKTQTRRLALPDDMVDYFEWGSIFAVYRGGRMLCGVGRTSAVQPGRGKKSLGRTLLRAIRHERLQDISEEDLLAEGGYNDYLSYMAVWDSINKRKEHQWNANPFVWVREFELAPWLETPRENG